jgi:hypothetical protein
MGRKKAKASKIETSDSMAGLALALKQKYGVEGVCLGKEHGEFFRGIPFQSLALEHLFGSDKLILGMTYGIAGPPQSFKSALMLDFGRMLASWSGGAVLVETEGRKISPGMLEDLFGDQIDRLIVRPVQSVDAAQATLTDVLTWEKTNYPERNNLLGLLVDSLTGSGTEERKKKVNEEGSAQKAYSSEALMWAQWLKTKASEFSGWPLVLMYVAHEKPKVGDTSGHGHAVTRGGGFAPEFHAATYLSVHRVKETKGAGKTLTQINIKTVKNSFGEFNRRIDALFVYDYSQQPSKMYFDWGHATVQLLLEQKSRVSDIIEITQHGEAMTGLTRTFTCKRMGVSHVTGAELGTAIQADEQLMNELRCCLGIRTYTQWEGAMPIPTTSVVEEESADPDLSETLPEISLDDLDT